MVNSNKRIFSGSEVVVKCLEQTGAKYVFGMCGHTILSILDALADSSIKFVSTRHEGIGAHAADGYYKATHRPALVLTHVGPGLTNAVTGVAHAALDCTPMIVISGEAPSYHAGREAFQEIAMHADASQHEIYRPFVKRTWHVGRLDLLPHIMARAHNLALSGRPGPVLVSIPMDLLDASCEMDIPCLDERMASGSQPTEKGERIQQAAELLVQAEAPVLYAGGGVVLSEASGPLTELADYVGIPVATSVMGKGAFDERHPLAVGVTGTLGSPVANKTTLEADLILAIGTRFNEHDACSWDPRYVFAIPPTKLIQLDIDPQEIGKVYPVKLGLVGDAKTVLSDLLEAIKSLTSRRDWEDSPRVKKIQDDKARWHEKLAPDKNSTDVPIHPARVLQEIREALPQEGILITDEAWSKSGVVQQIPFGLPLTHITAGGGLGTLGFAPAAALGAKLGRPNEPVVALQGDGAFTVFPQVLATAVEHNLAIVWVVLNNFGYKAITNIQTAFYERSYGTDFQIERTGEPYNPDFVLLAQSFGAHGRKVEQPADLRPALQEALASQKPSVIEVVVKNVPVPRTGYWDIENVYRQRYVHG